MQRGFATYVSQVSWPYIYSSFRFIYFGRYSVLRGSRWTRVGKKGESKVSPGRRYRCAGTRVLDREGGPRACARCRASSGLAIYFADRTNTVSVALGIIYGYGSVLFISSVVLWPTTSTGCLAVSISLAVLLLVISSSNTVQRPRLLINSEASVIPTCAEVINSAEFHFVFIGPPILSTRAAPPSKSSIVSRSVLRLLNYPVMARKLVSLPFKRLRVRARSIVISELN